MSNDILKHLGRMARIAAALVIVATTMAVACPQPEEITPVTTGNGSITKSEEARAFEAESATGIYLNDNAALTYDEDCFQMATNHKRRTFRIQADDQSEYLNIIFRDKIPQSAGDNAVCTVLYRLKNSGETKVIVQFSAVKADSRQVWLWNETMQLGIIMTSF
ncbi:MAG: hypothetical protein MJY60_01810 [Bacteroidales bacterium]|nr:hypothetical protein [Bacteroidales bacterium]